jgi:hypothetical protein
MSYPSGNSEIVDIRDELIEKMIGRKFLNSSTTSCTYTTPGISHDPMPALERTPQYIFVGIACEAGTFSPYLCPMNYDFYDFPSVSGYLHRRADLRDFLGRLSGKNLVCDCNFCADTCWARLLQIAFCETFGTLSGPTDINSLVNVIDIKNTAHNMDLLAGGLQPTRRRPAQLIPNGLKPHEHLHYALQEMHPFTSSSTSKNSVLLGLEWSPDEPEDLVLRRSEVSAIVVRLSIATKEENGLFI